MTKLSPMALLVAVALSASPVAAQDSDGGSAVEDGLDMLGEGARRLLEGLSEEIAPFTDEIRPTLRGWVEEMGPALDELADMIGDLNAYHPPERLPNGDIILRRKVPDLKPEGGEDAAPEGPIDL